MERSEAKAIVDREIEGLCDLLGVSYWRIRVYYERIEDRAAGEIERLSEYEKAGITIDPEKVGDAEELIDVLTHELLHVVHAPFDLAIDYAAEAMGGAEAARFRVVSRYAEEMVLRNLERLWGCCGAKERYLAGFRERQAAAAAGKAG